MRKDELRPQNLEEYIGQLGIKDLLSTSMQAAKARDEPIDHVLLNGPPGLGKTTLAGIIANELGWKIKAVIAPSLGTPTDILRLLISWKPKTILFIDEIHRLRAPVQEVLYSVLEDNKLQFDQAAIDLKPLTVIGATTNPGKLTNPFIDRFGLQLALDYYNLDDLSEIVQNTAEKLKVNMDWGAFPSTCSPSGVSHLPFLLLSMSCSLIR